jgi:hypothetical protein
MIISIHSVIYSEAAGVAVGAHGEHVGASLAEVLENVVVPEDVDHHHLVGLVGPSGGERGGTSLETQLSSELRSPLKCQRSSRIATGFS